MEKLTPAAALREALDRIGSQSEFARLCGVSQPSVWAWLNKGKSLPAEHVLAIEAASGVSRHALRPDIYPVEPSSHRSSRASAAPQRLSAGAR